MSEEKIESQPKTTNAALYDGGNVSVLLTYTGSEGLMSYPGIQVMTRPGRPVPPGFPETGRMTLPEAVILLRLLENAVERALASATLVFPPPVPATTGKTSGALRRRKK